MRSMQDLLRCQVEWDCFPFRHGLKADWMWHQFSALCNIWCTAQLLCLNGFILTLVMTVTLNIGGEIVWIQFPNNFVLVFLFLSSSICSFIPIFYWLNWLCVNLLFGSNVALSICIDKLWVFRLHTFFPFPFIGCVFTHSLLLFSGIVWCWSSHRWSFIIWD